jgi:flagellar biosynthesis regulator FlaF
MIQGNTTYQPPRDPNHYIALGIHHLRRIQVAYAEYRSHTDGCTRYTIHTQMDARDAGVHTHRWMHAMQVCTHRWMHAIHDTHREYKQCKYAHTEMDARDAGVHTQRRINAACTHRQRWIRFYSEFHNSQMDAYFTFADNAKTLIPN